MADQLFPVQFYDDTLVLVSHSDEPFVAMKPIVENMGLSWDTQFRKMTEKFGSTIVKMTMVAEDGKQREMLCLPLRKLPAWLYSIHVNKVAPNLREKIGRYQDECDEVLWQYWTKGFVVRPGLSQPTISQQLAAHGVRLRLTKELKGETDPAVRLALHQQLDHVSRLIGIETPALDAIGRTERPVVESPLINAFWEAVDLLLGADDTQQLNHSRTPSLKAVNLLQIEREARKAKLSLPPLNELRRVLRNSKQPRFIDVKTINSKHTGSSVKCWVFESDEGEGV